jgi:hypothetical protein
MFGYALIPLKRLAAPLNELGLRARRDDVNGRAGAERSQVKINYIYQIFSYK